MWIFKEHKLAVFVFPLVLFCSNFGAANAVLPSYIQALGVAHRRRDSLVEQYFELGLNYVEIISFLLLTHGISMSQAIEENSAKERPYKVAKL